MNPNELRDLQLRRAVAVDRVGLGFAQDAIVQVRELTPEMLGRVNAALERIGTRRGPNASPWGKDALAKLRDRIDGMVGDAVETMAGKLERDMRALGKREGEWLAGATGTKAPKSSDAVKMPIAGRTAREWLEAAGNTAKAQMKAQIAMGLSRGATDQVIGAVVRETMQNFGKRAAGIARTAARHVGARARQQVAQQNPDDFRGIMWVATLETNTCAQCWALHGRVFKLDVGPRPPAHPSCQCEAVLLLKGEADPDVLDADDFFGSQSTEWQNEALGRSRATLLRTGRVGSVRDLVNRRGRILRLEELAER